MAQLLKVLRSMYEASGTFPDKVEGEAIDVLLMYSCFNDKDMEAVLLSKSYGEYLSRTRDKDPVMKDLLGKANISLFKKKLPFNYESNKGLHLMFLPQLEKAYGQYKKNLRQAKGIIPYDKALSYVLDKYIFNLTKPYFQDELNTLTILENFKPTANLVTYCRREHRERLFILAEEVKRDLIIEDQDILLSNLAHGNYQSKLRKYVGDIDYPGLMLSCPDSLKQSGFERWLEMALRTAGIELPDKMLATSEADEYNPNLTSAGPVVNEDTPVEPVIVEDTPVTTFDKAMNPPEEAPQPDTDKVHADFKEKYLAQSNASQELKDAAFAYAVRLGFNAHIIAGRMKEKGMPETEAYIRVPTYILEERGKIDKQGFDEFTKRFG